MADHGQHPVAPPDPGAKHEHRDANAISMLKIGGGLILLLAAALGVTFGIWKLFQVNPPPVTTQPSAMEQRGVLPPEPRLQANPALDYEAFHQREDSVLHGYGWVDRGSGKVRVPIDSAIVMVAKRGLPVDTAELRSGQQGGASGDGGRSRGEGR